MIQHEDEQKREKYLYTLAKKEGGIFNTKINLVLRYPIHGKES